MRDAAAEAQQVREAVQRAVDLPASPSASFAMTCADSEAVAEDLMSRLLAGASARSATVDSEASASRVSPSSTFRPRDAEGAPRVVGASGALEGGCRRGRLAAVEKERPRTPKHTHLRSPTFGEEIPVTSINWSGGADS